jgi:hypothetical protein
MHEPSSIVLNERAARRVVLAQAIETGDSQLKLLSQLERDQLDAQARQAVMVESADGQALPPERFLDVRAQRVIDAVEARHPALAALRQEWPWLRWAGAALPLGALVLGVLTDVGANPHRVDLVSLPLLGIVAWNLVMYLLLFAQWLLLGRLPPRPGSARDRHGAGLMRWRRRTGQVRADITAWFQLRWQQVAQALTVQRWKRVLHLSAAAWAVGVALSLLMRGLVVEYRVGWESTFLDAGQVHSILSLLRLPTLLLFPFEPFTVQEVAALRFSQGGAAVAGARWVLMYVALLSVLVVLPRLVLAAFAWWRERSQARRVPLDLREPYFQRLLALLTVARVHLCLCTQRPADRAALDPVLVPEPEAQPPGTLVSTPQGDVLRVLDLSGRQAPAIEPSSQGGAAWLQWLRGRLPPSRGQTPAGDADAALAAARQLGDVVLLVSGAPGDLRAAAPLLRWLGKPVLVLVNQAGPASTGEPGLLALSEAEARAQGLDAQLLSFDDFARSWVQERGLLDAIRRCLPEPSRAGFDRLAAAWDERHRQRFSRAMSAIAEHLVFAARQVREVPSGGLTVKSLVPAERQAQATARQAAMDEVVQRLDVSAGEMISRLRQLHGVDAGTAVALQQQLQQKFLVQRSVDRPQAGMAGAATGAAMGASVDLLVGGLTLGAAAALGALVGGSAGYIAAAWKSRSTANGGAAVQLSDEMLQAITEAALLRYLAVAHHGRPGGRSTDELVPAWKAEVVAAVEAHREQLTTFWNAARTQPDMGRMAGGFIRELETIARQVLDRLYPPGSGA